MAFEEQTLQQNTIKGLIGLKNTISYVNCSSSGTHIQFWSPKYQKRMLLNPFQTSRDVSVKRCLFKVYQIISEILWHPQSWPKCHRPSVFWQLILSNSSPCWGPCTPTEDVLQVIHPPGTPTPTKPHPQPTLDLSLGPPRVYIPLPIRPNRGLWSVH